jgi:hypothetical protein
MALKKSRPILVEGIVYRWKFKAKKDNLTRYGQSARFSHVAIQAVEDPQAKMICWLESMVFIDDETHDGDTGSTPHKARFSPGDVKKLILVGLDCGWDLESKKQFDCPPDVELTDYRTKAR